MENKYRKNNNHCIDCRKKIGDRAKRCSSCNIKNKHKSGILNNKGKNHPNYKDGRCSKKYFCIDCGKELKNIYVKRCKSCSLLFYYKNHPNLHKGDKNPAFTTGITLNKYYCIDCGKEISLNNFYYGLKRCKVCSHRGRLSSRFGIPAAHGRGSYYKSIWMRSSYEIDFAYWLDLSGYKWQYKSKTFDLGNSTYTPDFYLSEFDCYIEIKGWWRDRAKYKFELFKQLYPTIKIKLLMKSDLQELGILL